jgi:hypothetical protein
MNRFSVIVLLIVVGLLVASPLFAQEPSAAGGPVQWNVLTAGFAMAIRCVHWPKARRFRQLAKVWRAILEQHPRSDLHCY